MYVDVSSMVSRTISLEQSAYNRLKAEKKPGESFSDLVRRMVPGSRPSFRSLAGALSAEEAASLSAAIGEMREAEVTVERAKDRVRRGRRGDHARHKRAR